MLVLPSMSEGGMGSRFCRPGIPCVPLGDGHAMGLICRRTERRSFVSVLSV